MKLNLPIMDQLNHCNNILIAGMGGGYDLFCGLPVYFELRDIGKNVHLANYSFSDIEYFEGGHRLSPTLVGVDAAFNEPVVYFPELYLSKWFREVRNEDLTIWSFHKTGTRDLLSNYNLLIDYLNIDGILLIDGGVDSLLRGDEEETASLIEDAISLFVVNELKQIETRLIGCIGLGAELGLSYNQLLENIAELTRKNGFLGNCSLTPQMPSYQLYEKAVFYVHSQPFQDPSVINASIISAVRGEFGNFHLTQKTHGSHLKISPFMSQYWFFDLIKVADQNLFLPHIRETATFWDSLQAFLSTREFLPKRQNSSSFLL
ncbi:MAG: DUF1152 domain-containing protein [Calditrichae bacterium]|nr:DUF1152 domain-containing protein [Calditrichia bacterium]